jgi:hypothetical protein
VLVPRSLAIALPDAVGAPVVVTGGHAPAHAPEHVDALPVSFAHRYTARPEPSVRNVSPDDEAVLITAALPLAALLGAEAAELAGAAAPVLLLFPLAHAAASTATPTAPPTVAASLAGADIRFPMGKRIACLLSSEARLRQASFVITVDTDTGDSAIWDWTTQTATM